MFQVTLYGHQYKKQISNVSYTQRYSTHFIIAIDYIMDSNTIVAYVGCVLSVIATIITAVNHKRIRSKCCGKDVTTSIDIENTSPVILSQKPPV